METTAANAPADLAPRRQAELLGDARALAEQLGSAPGAAGLECVVAGPDAPRVVDAASLLAFLAAYRDRVLLPVELPVIRRAWLHAGRFEVRELLALDRELAGCAVLANSSAASRAAGRRQLRRLLPLRDQRLVKRYLAAVERGEADGWHTVVYGVTLALYSLPLRQGLLGYAAQTLGGLGAAAGRGIGLGAAQLEQLMSEATAAVPGHVQQMLADSASGFAAAR
jgi:urease accessory protein UreF